MKMLKYLGGLLLLITVMAFKTQVTYADSVAIDINSERTEVTVNDNVYINIQIESESLFDDFEANLTYDDDVLDYLGGSPVATGSSGFLKITDMEVTEGTQSRKYSLKFKALEVGTSEISFSGRAMVYNHETGREMPVSSNVLTIKVKAAETASTNASLKSLKISPSKLSPEFDKNVLEYTVDVDYNTKKLVINAIPEDSKATVSTSGNDSLKEGENKVSVTVLAESGNVIEYIINVNREFAPEESVPEEEVIEPAKTHGIFEIVRIDDKTYALYSGRYQLVEPGSEVLIPAGYVKTQIIRSDISITAYASEKNPDSEFLLIYAINEFGEGGFYQYDRIERTLQRYVPQESYVRDDTEEIDVPEEPMQSEEYKSSLNIAGVIIALLSALSVLLLVIIIRMYMKQKGYRDDLD